MKYDVNYFIEKLGAIPEDKWCVNEFMIGEEPDARYCVLGHCGYRNDMSVAPEGDVLIALFSEANLPFAASVNNNRIAEFQQDSPKKRIMAALEVVKGRLKSLNVLNQLTGET